MPSRIVRRLPEPAAAPVVISEVEWRRREKENRRTALELAGGRVYGAGGAAELLGVAPTTLVSRLNALGLRDTGARPRG
jgi:hypothetical protein